MYVSQIWRYPVKSMGGEKLESAFLGPLGVVGDRLVHVEDASGRFVTSRTHPRLLGHRANLDSSGEPWVDGLQWTNPSLLLQVEDQMKHGDGMKRDDSMKHDAMKNDKKTKKSKKTKDSMKHGDKPNQN